jgi:hypothetical protein
MATETNKIILQVEVDDRGQVDINKLKNSIRGVSTEIGKVNDVSKKMSSNLGNVRSATGSASGAVVELGRTISDSNYGFPAMANNVQQLATQMTFVVKESGGVKGAIKDLGKAMTGAGGLLLLFTIGITLLERFALNSRKVKDEVKEETDAIKENNKALEKNISLRKRNEVRMEELTNLFTYEFRQGLKDSRIFAETNTLALIELSERLTSLGIKEAKLLKDESISIENRILGAIKLSELYENQTEINELRLKQDKALQEGNKNLAREIGLQIIGLQKQKIAIQETVSEILKSNEIVLDPKRKLAESVLAIEDIDAFKERANLFIEALEQTYDLEVNALEKKEIKLQAINQKSLAEQQRLKRSEKFVEEERRQNRLRTLDALATATSAASELFAEGTTANKAFGIATATIDTYIAANSILKDPALIGQPFARFAGAAAAIATGLANVKRIMSVDAQNGETSVGVSAPPTQPAQFNVVGASPQSQLAQTIAEAEQQPTRAYVVAEDVTSAQQLDRETIQGASLG